MCFLSITFNTSGFDGSYSHNYEIESQNYDILSQFWDKSQNYEIDQNYDKKA